MKTPLLVLATAVLALSGCNIGNLGSGNAHDTYIEIPPGTQIPPDKQKELANILSKYDTRLYWVWDIDRKPNRGDLSCVYVDKTLLNEVSKTITTGTAYSSIQIGARPNMSNCDQIHHTPSTHHTSRAHHTPFLHHTPQTHSSTLKEQDYRQSRALVKEVTPILQKYTHR